MAISRHDALERIKGLSPQIEEHLAKMQRFPFAIDYNHWRAEVRAAVEVVERLARHVGRRTGSEVMSHVAQWKQAIEDPASSND